jgi:hypothetical protein
MNKTAKQAEAEAQRLRDSAQTLKERMDAVWGSRVIAYSCYRTAWRYNGLYEMDNLIGFKGEPMFSPKDDADG